jgi:hypothetical protein
MEVPDFVLGPITADLFRTTESEGAASEEAETSAPIPLPAAEAPKKPGWRMVSVPRKCRTPCSGRSLLTSSAPRRAREQPQERLRQAPRYPSLQLRHRKKPGWRMVSVPWKCRTPCSGRSLLTSSAPRRAREQPQERLRQAPRYPSLQLRHRKKPGWRMVPVPRKCRTGLPQPQQPISRPSPSDSVQDSCRIKTLPHGRGPC